MVGGEILLANKISQILMLNSHTLQSLKGQLIFFKREEQGFHSRLFCLFDARSGKITIGERLVEGQAWSECKQQQPPQAFSVLVVVTVVPQEFRCFR